MATAVSFMSSKLLLIPQNETRVSRPRFILLGSPLVSVHIDAEILMMLLQVFLRRHSRSELRSTFKLYDFTALDFMRTSGSTFDCTK